MRCDWSSDRIVVRMRRALLGGTFDPPHLAHLLAGEVAFRQLSTDVVTFLPAGAPWQKADLDVSASEHRWEMTRLAVDGVPYFEADAREVLRDGWTYTMDTVEGFDPNDELTLVLGADAAAGMPTWQRWRELVARVDLAVAPRPGVSRAQVEEAVGRPVTWLDMPEVQVSGTEIRARARTGRAVRFLVRDGVWRYLVDHGLYLDGHNLRPTV